MNDLYLLVLHLLLYVAQLMHAHVRSMVSIKMLVEARAIEIGLAPQHRHVPPIT